jgi:hypothetical protein
MKKEARLLLGKAIDSLVLSIEVFNRPSDRGRVSTVLILLDHAFEMFLKASILHKGGKIRRPREKQTIGFDECIRKAFSDGQIRFLSEEETLLLQTINSLRDAAQHHLIDVSEPFLYLQAQAGLTLFRDLLKLVFDTDLNANLPERVLPVSTTPPMDLANLFDWEVRQIKQLLRPGSRRRIEARAKLRALAIMEGAVQGEKLQPGTHELNKLGMRIHSGVNWEDVFPGVASINITSVGTGPSIDLRITKKEGVPVHIVPEGTPGATVIGIRRVNELDFYNLGRDDVAEKVRISPVKTTAMVWYLKLKDDPDCFKEIKIGKTIHQRYSQNAISKIRNEISKVSVDDVWQQYRARKLGEKG